MGVTTDQRRGTGGGNEFWIRFPLRSKGKRGKNFKISDSYEMTLKMVLTASLCDAAQMRLS